jgi:hypothetical protein
MLIDEDNHGKPCDERERPVDSGMFLEERAKAGSHGADFFMRYVMTTFERPSYRSMLMSAFIENPQSVKARLTTETSDHQL